MDKSLERIAWTDVETTGFHPWEGERLLQVAIIITDGHYNELAVHESKLKLPVGKVAEIKLAATPYVQAMHEKTGLWDALSSDQGFEHEDWEEHVLAWLQEQVPEPGRARMGGNSITLDRNFLQYYMPRVNQHLSYRSLDMSSVEYHQILTDGREEFTKLLRHEALSDIRESIEQARYHASKSIPF